MTAESETKHPLQRTFDLAKATVGAAILLLVFIGPPVAFVHAVFTQPLFTTESVTVTKTVHGGAIPESIPLLLIWGLIVLTVAFANRYGMGGGF